MRSATYELARRNDSLAGIASPRAYEIADVVSPIPASPKYRRFGNGVERYGSLTHPEALAAYQSIGTDDFSLTITFKMLGSSRNTFIFQNGSRDTAYLGIWVGGSKHLQLVSSIKLTTPLGTTGKSWIDPTIFYKVHTYKVQRLNGTLSVWLDDDLALEKTGQTNIDMSTMTQAPYTSAICELREVTITNLTTNTVVWELPDSLKLSTAAVNPTYTGYMSNTPLSFKLWWLPYKLYSTGAVPVDSELDIEFWFKRTVDTENTATSVIYAAAYADPFGIYWYADGYFFVFSNAYRYSSNPNKYAILSKRVTVAVDTLVKVKVQLRRTGWAVYIDGELNQSATIADNPAISWHGITCTYSSPNVSTTYIQVFKYTIFSVTENRMLADMVPQSTQINALVMHNVDASEDGWITGPIGISSSAIASGVFTLNDMRKCETPLTFVVKARCKQIGVEGGIRMHMLAGVGQPWGSTSVYGVIISLWEEWRFGSYNLKIQAAYAYSTSTVISAAAPVTSNIFDDDFVVVMIVDKANRTLRTYVNGVLCAETFAAAVTLPLQPYLGDNLSNAANILQGSTYANDTKATSIWYSNVYDHAFSHDEVVGITHTLMDNKGYKLRWTSGTGAGENIIAYDSIKSQHMRLYRNGQLIEDVINTKIECNLDKTESADYTLVVDGFHPTSSSLSLAIANGGYFNIENVPKSISIIRLDGASIVGDASTLSSNILHLYLTSTLYLTGSINHLTSLKEVYLYQLTPASTLVANLDLFTKIDYILAVSNSPNTVVATTAGISRNIIELRISQMPGLTGDLSDLPECNLVKEVCNCANVTGYIVPGTNLTAGGFIAFYGNTLCTVADYEATIQACVDSNFTGKYTLLIDKSVTSAADANIQLLTERGWTVKKM